MTRSHEQERAADALKKAREVAAKTTGLQRAYRSYVDRLGPAIVMMGLGQALATELAAAGSNPTKDDQRAHRLLFEHIEAWLCRKGGVYDGGTDLLDSIFRASEEDYLLAQAESLAWLQWHKKFCRALLQSGDQDD